MPVRKLTDEQVVEIRLKYKEVCRCCGYKKHSIKSLAMEYGVSPGYVWELTEYCYRNKLAILRMEERISGKSVQATRIRR